MEAIKKADELGFYGCYAVVAGDDVFVGVAVLVGFGCCHGRHARAIAPISTSTAIALAGMSHRFDEVPCLWTAAATSGPERPGGAHPLTRADRGRTA